MRYVYSDPPPFPPSFDGNPWSYGFGLFGDIVAAALALTMLLSFLFENARNREAMRRAGSPVPIYDIPRWSPLYLYRVGQISMLWFVLLRALPDALWMLAWGEVSETTFRVLLKLDMVGDGLALGPLFFAVLCWLWGRQSIPQKLLSGSGSLASPRPSWSILWKNGRIVLVVLVIAIGVTLGKASA